MEETLAFVSTRPALGLDIFQSTPVAKIFCDRFLSELRNKAQFSNQASCSSVPNGRRDRVTGDRKGNMFVSFARTYLLTFLWFSRQRIYFIALHSVCLRIFGVWTQFVRAVRFVLLTWVSAHKGHYTHCACTAIILFCPVKIVQALFSDLTIKQFVMCGNVCFSMYLW